MKKNLSLLGLIALWIMITGLLSWGAVYYRDALELNTTRAYQEGINSIKTAQNTANDFIKTGATTIQTATTYWTESFNQASNNLHATSIKVTSSINTLTQKALSWPSKILNQISTGFKYTVNDLKISLNKIQIFLTNKITSLFNTIMHYPAMIIKTMVDGLAVAQISIQETFTSVPKAFKSLQEEPPADLIAYGGQLQPPEIKEEKKSLKLSDLYDQKDESGSLNNIEPAAGVEEPSWPVVEPSITVESVLVPRQITVISSSQDGKISNIFVHNGDYFKKGDALIAYDCADLEAEAEIARIEKEMTKKKAKDSSELFKLNIISDLDRFNVQAQDRQADAKQKVYEARMNDCTIRALFDGRVTKRLANEGEYTRTDRVLLEVASSETMQAEFLVPSKWLRWVNIGAPVTLLINETEREYSAKIIRIFGEVDPVSQSIQMVAELDPYEDKLLPGMSGQATLDIEKIRAAGVIGYLEARRP